MSKKLYLWVKSAVVTGFLAMSVPVMADPVDTQTIPVQVIVEPMAEIALPDQTSIHLTVPPTVSTFPNSGLRFIVRGNARASLSATPTDFVLVQHYITQDNPAHDDGPRFLGRAVHSSGYEIGYNLTVEFPSGSYYGMSGENGVGTSSASANVSTGPKPGYLHMTASHFWTPDGSMPSVGDYHGTVVLTLAASNL